MTPETHGTLVSADEAANRVYHAMAPMILPLAQKIKPEERAGSVIVLVDTQDDMNATLAKELVKSWPSVWRPNDEEITRGTGILYGIALVRVLKGTMTVAGFQGSHAILDKPLDAGHVRLAIFFPGGLLHVSPLSLPLTFSRGGTA